MPQSANLFGEAKAKAKGSVDNCRTHLAWHSSKPMRLKPKHISQRRRDCDSSGLKHEHINFYLSPNASVFIEAHLNSNAFILRGRHQL